MSKRPALRGLTGLVLGVPVVVPLYFFNCRFLRMVLPQYGDQPDTLAFGLSLFMLVMAVDAGLRAAR